MKYLSLPVGALQTNCYLLWDEESRAAVLIDPGAEAQRILALLRQERLSLRAVLLTHGHFDHVGATGALHEATGCPVYVHEADLALPSALRGRLVHTALYGEGDELAFGPLCFRVLHTPGHSPGSVTLLCGELVFCGDTLFAGSCGRTDLALGDPARLFVSLARLGKLPEDSVLLCGHGAPTTLRRELAENPYLQYALGVPQ